MLPERVAKRRDNNAFYRRRLGEVPGVSFMPEASYGRANCWLTCIQIDPKAFGATREDVRLKLESENIESRPVWKPMHLQPVFKDCRVRGGKVGESLFEFGLCLPSGSSLGEADRERMVELMVAVRKG